MNREKLREIRKQFSGLALTGLVIDALLEDDEPPRTGWFTAKLNPHDTKRVHRELRRDGIVWTDDGRPSSLPFSEYRCVEWEEQWSEWIEWPGGGEAPIPDGVEFEVCLRHGDPEPDNKASQWVWSWDEEHPGQDIVMYRYRLDQMPMVRLAPITKGEMPNYDEPPRTGWFTAKLNPHDTKRVRRELRSNGIVYAEDGRPVETSLNDYCCVKWEPPRIDRSLRGLVRITDLGGGVGIYDARDKGMYAWDELVFTWLSLEEMGWTVRPLTYLDIGFKVRKWHQLEDQEKFEYKDACSLDKTYEHDFNLALDIATRRTR